MYFEYTAIQTNKCWYSIGSYMPKKKFIEEENEIVTLVAGKEKEENMKCLFWWSEFEVLV